MCQGSLNHCLHILDYLQLSQTADDALSELQSSAPRFRLEMLKSKAKRSLTESLESILSRGNRSRSLQEHSGSVDYDSTLCTPIHDSNKEPSFCQIEHESPLEIHLKTHGSMGDLSRDLEGNSWELPEEPAHQGFRRRANTLSHFPVTAQEFPEPVQKSPTVPQRKLMRHHSVSTETPHKRK
ncbi:hypothetical protein FKM82_018758 [Ascaphus truei]